MIAGNLICQHLLPTQHFLQILKAEIFLFSDLSLHNLEASLRQNVWHTKILTKINPSPVFTPAPFDTICSPDKTFYRFRKLKAPSFQKYHMRKLWDKL